MAEDPPLTCSVNSVKHRLSELQFSSYGTNSTCPDRRVKGAIAISYSIIRLVLEEKLSELIGH